MTQLSDEFLLAYLDGQLEKGQSAEVGDLIAANAEVSRRVLRLRKTQSQLAETFGAIAREDVVVPKGIFPSEEAATRTAAQEARREKARPQKSGGASLLFIAAVFASGVLGGYSATYLREPPPPPPQKDTERPPKEFFDQSSWPLDIARFHSFFPRETLTPYPDAISNAELIRFQLAKITGKGIPPPDFSTHGFTLFRGQTFNYRQDRMMQLTYSSKTEPPLTVYVLSAPDLADSEPAAQTLGSARAVSWVGDHVRFLIIGEKSVEDLKVLAVLTRGQMPRKP